MPYLILGYTTGTGAIDPNAPKSRLVQTMDQQAGAILVGDASGDAYFLSRGNVYGKVNESGQIWAKEFNGGDGALGVSGFVPMANGDTWVLANDDYFDAYSYGQVEVGLLLKFDASGNLVTTYQYDAFNGGSLHFDGTNLLVNDGNEIIKINPTNGNIIWQYTYSQSVGAGAVLDSSGNMFCSFGISDTRIIKIDNNGDILWQRSYNIDGESDFFKGMVALSGGDIIVASSHNLSTSQRKPVIRRISGVDGSIIWEKFDDDAGVDRDGAGIAVDASDNVYVLRQNEPSGIGQIATFHVYSFDANGNERWTHEWTFADSNPGSGVVNTPHSIGYIGTNVYVFGHVDEFGKALFRFEPDGSGVPSTSLDSNFTYQDATTNFTNSSSTNAAPPVLVTKSAASIAGPVIGYGDLSVTNGTLPSFTNHPFA